MTTTISASTAAVLNNLTSTCLGDPAELNLVNSNPSQNYQQQVFLSAMQANPDSSYTITTSTTTTEALPNSSGYVTIPNSNSGFAGGNSGIFIGGNTWPNSGMPYIGDPVPNAGGGFIFPPMQPQPFKIVPDLESLEEGVHDIPGGKVIIKKIKITEKQLDDAIEETLGHEAPPEEKAKVLKEIEELIASEEREV